LKHWYENNFLLMLLSGVVFVGGYFFLRLAYHMADKMPFTQEIVLIVLGTLATVLITAMLLNKQTAVELEKEQSVKFIELKTQTYERLIDTIESIVRGKKVGEAERTALRFNTHRLAIFAEPEVLEEYQCFLEVFAIETADGIVSVEDANQLSEALARLTIRIRDDLVGELDDQSGKSASWIRAQIMANAKASES